VCMMKWVVSIGFSCMLWAVGYGQNLVNNGSFEEYTGCPDNAGVLDYTLNWVRIQGTPEYFNSCATLPWVATPTNGLGYQVPYDGGQAYAGIILYADSDWFSPPELLREVIGVELTEALVPGLPVQVSFKASPAAFGSPGARVRWTTNSIGLKFTFAPLVALQEPIPATNDADIQLEAVLSDTAEWTLVTGTIVPDSAYDAIILGNFKSDSLLIRNMIDSAGTYGIGYAYIDDVIVTELFDGLPNHVVPCAAYGAWFDVNRSLLFVTRASPESTSVAFKLLDNMGRTVTSFNFLSGATYAEIHCQLSSLVYWLIPISTGFSSRAIPLTLQNY
jgi:OmpA-OmpF porin, OOP family